MAYQTSVFQSELVKLDKAQSELKAEETSLRDLILGDTFLEEHSSFFRALSKFQNAVVGLVEAVERPLEGLPITQAKTEPEEPFPEEEEKSKRSFDYPLAILLAVGLVVSLFLAYLLLIPGMVPVYLFIIAISLAFSAPIAKFLKDFLMKTDEEKEELLEDWVTDSLERLRNEYQGSVDMAKFQDQSADDEAMERYKRLGVDESLWVRSLERKEDLTVESLNIIGKVMLFCDRNFWTRKAVLVSAITMAQQAQSKVAV